VVLSAFSNSTTIIEDTLIVIIVTLTVVLIHCNTIQQDHTQGLLLS
jgi:hypothetical protein